MAGLFLLACCCWVFSRLGGASQIATSAGQPEPTIGETNRTRHGTPTHHFQVTISRGMTSSLFLPQGCPPSPPDGTLRGAPPVIRRASSPSNLDRQTRQVAHDDARPALWPAQDGIVRGDWSAGRRVTGDGPAGGGLGVDQEERRGREGARAGHQEQGKGWGKA